MEGLKVLGTNLAFTASSLRDNVMSQLISKDFSESQAYPWTSPMVGAWLRILGLKPYLDAFLENGLDGITLLRLNKRHFTKCLGIQNLNHVHSLRLGLHLLKTRKIDYSNWEWSCSGIETWLQKRGLSVVAKIFKENAVHGGVLFSLTRRSLYQFMLRVQSPSFDIDSFSPFVTFCLYGEI